MIVISFALVKFYAFAILYVLIVMQIKLVVHVHFPALFLSCFMSSRFLALLQLFERSCYKID